MKFKVKSMLGRVSDEEEIFDDYVEAEEHFHFQCDYFQWVVMSIVETDERLYEFSGTPDDNHMSYCDAFRKYDL